MDNYEQNKKGLFFQIIEVFLLLILIVLFIGLLYMLYYNFPGSPEKPEVILENMDINDSYSNIEANQFYPNMKYNHNNITYYIDDFCDRGKKIRILEAFDEITTNVPELIFIEINDKNADIQILCSEDIKNSIEADHFIAGEGGPKEIIQTGKYNIIVVGTILLYGDKKDLPECVWPNVELHELMHVFGFNHTSNKQSLMYPYLMDCNMKFDKSIIDEMKRLYTQKNLPDIYFEKVNAIKKGRYLDFNLSIKNSGDIDALDVNISIFDEGELIDQSEVGRVKYGAGVFLEMKNLKLIHRNSKEVSFVIDYNGKINELDKNNNIAKIKFA